MLGALGQALNSVHFGPHERKVKRYLNEATPDSVLEDLKKALAPKIREVQDLWTTFDAYCVEDSAHQRHWNVTSFRQHIEKKHPDVASEAVVQLLWRCFLYFAYHPFPRDVTDSSKVDSSGFQRAVSLLAVQGTDILGTQDEGEYFWRHDDAFFRRANFQRTFRSIGLPEGPNNQPTVPTLEEDVMDVLAMTQPQSISLAPSQDQLGPAARKLLGEGPAQTAYRVTRKDFSTLLSLLLRLRLDKAKWGSYFHYGTFDNAEPDDEELANILVNGLAGDKNDGEDLTSEQLLRAMELLPNLNLRFHQLWAVLFQPPTSADDHMLSQAPEPSGAVPGRILGAITLFIPHPEFSTRSRTTIQDARISLEKPTDSLQTSDDLTMTRLVKALKHDAHPHLMLLTSDGTTAPATVVGAYFPGPLWIKADGGEMREFKTGTSHLLFQLEPQFRLLRWTYPDIPLTDIVNARDALSLEAIAASDKTSPTSNQAYWIGDPERMGASLQIDPETRSALLTSNFTDAKVEGAYWYNDMGRDSDRSDKSPKKHWEVTVKLGQLNFFRVSGGIDVDLASGRIIRAKDQARYMREATKPRIEGEELKKRIQGFGSTSLQKELED